MLDAVIAFTRLARAAGLCLLCWCASVSATALEVLIIPDQDGGGVSALAANLQGNGVGVTTSPLTEGLYDGATPPPAGFDAVIVLDGRSGGDMPDVGQKALVNYAASGGRVITSEGIAYDFSLGRFQLMRDLILFDSSQTPATPIPAKELAVGSAASPLLAGLLAPFVLNGICETVSLHLFATERAQSIIASVDGAPGMAARSFGSGSVVGFAFTASGADAAVLGDPTVEQLYLNAVQWRAGAVQPQITLTGGVALSVPWLTAFVDPGYSASDPIDGDITSTVVVSGWVDVTRVGSYVLTYSVTDTSGISAAVQRSVLVEDLTPPIIALAGGTPTPWPLDVPYVDAGATATDVHDGDVSSTLSLTGVVDVSRPGPYFLTYTAHDVAGNTATAMREVDVYAPPSVTCAVARTSLPWTGGLTDVGLTWNAASRRPIVSVACSVTQDEALSAGISPAHDAELTIAVDGTPDHLLLRSARDPGGEGRVYLIIITATDDLGQIGRAMCAVIVPKGGGAKHLATVSERAAADLKANIPLAFDSFVALRANG